MGQSDRSSRPMYVGMIREIPAGIKLHFDEINSRVSRHPRRKPRPASAP